MYQFRNPEYYANYIIIGCQTLSVVDGVVTFNDIEEMHKYQHGLSLNGFVRVQEEVIAPEISVDPEPVQIEPEMPIEHDDDSHEDMDH